MYRLSQLMSTPVASQCGRIAIRNYLLSDETSLGNFLALILLILVPLTICRVLVLLKCQCSLWHFACDFLAGDSSFDCCSLDPLTGSYLPCRRSPRLLTNGYYIWTEDSFLCDRDGNITLSPSQTSVMYKENSVRVFRKKKRARRSFSSLLRLGAPRSWLRGSIFGDAGSSPGEAVWPEGAGRLDAHPCSDGGGDFDWVLTDDWASERPDAQSVAASSSGHGTPEPPRKDPLRGALQPRGTAAEHLRGGILDHSKTSLLGEISFQTVLLAACLAMSACARWLLGGLLAGVFTCSLTVMIAYVAKSLLAAQPRQLLLSRPPRSVCQNLTTIRECL